MVAIQDEGSRHGSAAFDALKRLGTADPILPDYRGSYALAGYSGIKKPSWVTQQQANGGQGPSEISLKVALIGKYTYLQLNLAISNSQGRRKTVRNSGVRNSR